MLNRADLESIHRHSSRHREVVVGSSRCGCFYCLSEFSPTEITDWVDGQVDDDDLQLGATALCPRCGIDAVLRGHR